MLSNNDKWFLKTDFNILIADINFHLKKINKCNNKTRLISYPINLKEVLII